MQTSFSTPDFASYKLQTMDHLLEHDFLAGHQERSPSSNLSVLADLNDEVAVIASSQQQKVSHQLEYLSEVMLRPTSTNTILSHLENLTSTAFKTPTYTYEHTRAVHLISPKLDVERLSIETGSCTGGFAHLLYEMAVSVTCFSSVWMTHLMNWRNPQDEASPSIIDLGKKIVTELSLPVLTLTAAIETVVYTTLHLGALALSPLTERPLNFLAHHGIIQMRRSAQFTTWWTLVTLVTNVTRDKLAVEELEALK